MSWDLNPDKLVRFRRMEGREFKTDGARKMNERSPKDFKLRFGFLESFSLEARRVRGVRHV